MVVDLIFSATGLFNIILSIFAASILLPAIVKRVRLWWVFWGIPGPDDRAYPLIGHALALRGSPDVTYVKIRKMIMNHIKKGQEVSNVWLGTVPNITVFCPDSAETLLRSSDHIEKSFIYRFIQPWVGLGLLTAKGPKWRTRRKLLTPTFHFSILQDFLEIINEQSDLLLSKLDSLSKNDRPFDIFPHLTLCALDIICETAMGKSIQAQQDENSEYVEAVARATELTMMRQRSPWLWSDFVYSRSKSGKEHGKRLKVLHDFTKSVIKDKMRSGERQEQDTKKRLAFLDLLLKVSDGGKVISMDGIQEEVDTFMFEGHDTTSSGMVWALHIIATHMDVQKMIQHELNDIFGGNQERKVTMDDLRKMEYMEMVIKETMRLLPPVPVIARVTTKDCVLDGHRIPAGTECIISIRMIHRNQNIWKDPDKFDAERFTADNSVGRHPYAYIPFSAGPRNCIGQRFAMMEEKVILSHILRKYTVTSEKTTEDLRPMGDLILRPKYGLEVTLTQREFDSR